MSYELGYALLTPDSLFKNRAGGIISRLFADPNLEFVAARMFVFSDEFLAEYQQVLCEDMTEPAKKKAWHDYIENKLSSKNADGSPRCMLLLFKGDNAVRYLKENLVGSFADERGAYTVRSTYGELIRNEAGDIVHFEPGVITCPVPELNKKHLELFAKYALTDGGIVAGDLEDKENSQTTLVMLKPDNFYVPSHKPGAIIDTFSSTCLQVIGAKLFSMTVAQGEEFYGPLKPILVDKLQPAISQVALDRLANAFDFDFSEIYADEIAKMLSVPNAEAHFARIVEYMTGVDPRTISPDLKATTSKTHCLAILYQGPDAIGKVRDVLGSTNPEKAAPGTVRNDFGTDILHNGVHASDAPENAMRERAIIGLTDETDAESCTLVKIIQDYLKTDN